MVVPMISTFRFAGCAALALSGAAISIDSFAQDARPRPDMSCAYFSPNPGDTAGPPIMFYADLSADEESAVTESPGTGRAEFTLDRATLAFTWKVRFGALTSPATALHVHGPQTPGGEAGILFDLAPKGARDGVEGSMVLNDGLLGYLIQDRMYVNLHTTKYPAGELRGPVKKSRPKC
jgi:hypothetical protein